MASPRDRRSLRRQIVEDSDAITLSGSEVEADYGAGITTFLQDDQPGPGLSSTRIPEAQPQVEEKIPRRIKEVDFEDVSDPSDSETPITARARTAVVVDSDVEELTATSARTVAVEALTTPTRAVHDVLSVGATPSTPDEQRQFDDDNCPATRAEFRKMRKQLKETRMVVNTLIQRCLEDDQFLDMRTLLRVAQRSNQTTRDMLEQAKLEITGQLQSQGDRVLAMEVGYSELNDWAMKIADKASPEE